MDATGNHSTTGDFGATSLLTAMIKAEPQNHNPEEK